MKQTTLALVIVVFCSQFGQSQVLETAISKEGERIGSRMCFDYVEQVLIESGQKIDTSGMVDSVLPGDILVCYGFYRVEVKPSKYKVISGIGAHIAIVVKSLGKDCYLVLDQNGNEKKDPVQYRIINLMEYGVVYSYGYCFVRPVPGEYTEETARLVRGFDVFPVNNYSGLN